MRGPILDLDDYEYADECSLGYCIKCGQERTQCEPDARKYPCDYCETNTVYGAQELLMMGLVG
jgi:hypothetical protein